MIVMFIFDLYSADHINNELHMMKRIIASAILTILVGTAIQNSIAKDFLNVSYDPTRELYEDVNKEFGKYWKSLAMLQKTFSTFPMIRPANSIRNIMKNLASSGSRKPDRRSILNSHMVVQASRRVQ